VAVDAFLARGDLAAFSRRSYAQTLNRLAVGVGGGRALSTFDAVVLDGAVQAAWGACAPATWNRHVATVRSFVAFCRRRGWMGADVAVGVDRRREPADRTRAIPYAQLERLWRRSDIAVREKALWRHALRDGGARVGGAVARRRRHRPADHARGDLVALVCLAKCRCQRVAAIPRRQDARRR
jgi:site-specific recombinase XerD